MVATPASLSALSAPRRLLFPGRIPSRPRSAGSLVMQLNAHGLHARPTRNTTLINLAAHLPAAVLSDLVGMHPNTNTASFRAVVSALNRMAMH